MRQNLIPAEPIFVVGTGRNGTRSIFRMLRGNSRIEAHHEYRCEEIQKISCLHSMNLLDKEHALQLVYEHYAAALNYCNKDIWLDSTNKASWIICLLKQAFPRARFIHLVRDPRRVVPSYYYKLREEMYEKNAVLALANWIDKGCPAADIPPAEKKYWWNLELTDDLKVSNAENQRTRFERCCLHWSNATKVISEAFSNLDSACHLTVRLEDLTLDANSIHKFASFLHLDNSAFFSDFLQKPRNVFLPLELNCTLEQLETLKVYCNHQAKAFGYDLSEQLPPINY